MCSSYCRVVKNPENPVFLKSKLRFFYVARLQHCQSNLENPWIPSVNKNNVINVTVNIFYIGKVALHL